MDALKETYRSYLEQLNAPFTRYLHDKLPWGTRLMALYGARGVGKTTMLLQHIKQHDNPEESLFVMADDLYFTEHTLLETAQAFRRLGGKRLYIDEIHKYPDWSRTIKNIYDQMPDLQVVYTGSSLVELEQGGADLSRRALRYKLHGLSFREFFSIATGIVLPTYTLDEVLQHKVEFPMRTHRPLQWFERYLREGYYPFFVEGAANIRLDGVVKQTIEYDIPQFAQMEVASVQKLRKLLYMLAQSVPFKPNMSKIERDMGISRNRLPQYFEYLEKVGLLNPLRTKAEGMKLLEKIDKIYLNNPNLAYLLSAQQPNIGAIRETIFLAWLQVEHFISSSKVSDFEVDDYTFEIGGRNKTKRQIAGVERSYIAMDDIEYAHDNVIPLWHFGFLY